MFVKVAFSALRRFIDDLNAKKAQAEVRAADLPRWFPPGKSKFVIIPDGQDVAALPQVTGGIRLARIRRLVRILRDDQSDAAKTFFGNYTAAYTSAMGAVAIPHAQIRDSNWVHVPSAKLRALVTLIAFYIRQFKTTSPDQSVYAAKYRTVLMSRTEFSAMFEQLPDDERTHYRQNPNAWVQFICSDIMSRVTGGVGVAPDGYLVEFLISDQGTLTGAARVQRPLTRRQWLVGMLHGKDLLSAAANPITWHSAESKRLYKDTHGVGHRLRGLAGLGDKLDPGPNGEVNYATIIEFRATQKRVPYTEWQNLRNPHVTVHRRAQRRDENRGARSAMTIEHPFESSDNWRTSITGVARQTVAHAGRCQKPVSSGTSDQRVNTTFDCRR